MKNTLFVLINIASTLSLCGQTKNIVVYIDTLHITSGEKFQLYTSKTVEYYDSPFVWVEKIIDSIPNNYFATKDSIFIESIEIKNDSFDLRIPLDNEGGFLEILNLYKQPFDTLRISNWKVFSNCYTDTLKISCSYYRRNPGDNLPNSFKQEEKFIINQKNCQNSTPQKISLKLNNQNYCLETSMTPGRNYVTWSHGYNKDIYKLKNLKPKRKLIYRATMSETKKYSDKATIRL